MCVMKPVYSHCRVHMCVFMYRVAVPVFVEVPGGIETPLHLWNRLRGVSQLKEEERRKDRKK